MRLTQIQDELIDAAHSQGQVDPNTFARLLHHDFDDVHVAIRELVERGLLESVAGDAYRLTAHGQAVHQVRQKANRAAVADRTRSWQPR